MTRQPLSVAITLPPSLSAHLCLDIAAMVGRLGFSALHVAELPAGISTESLIEASAPAMLVRDLPDRTPGTVHVNDVGVIGRARAKLDAQDALSPLLVAIPASIGRTLSEAQARADADPRFGAGRHPKDVGLFGTFQVAQDQVVAMVRAGADGLILDVPLEHDGADLLAQLRSLIISAAPRLLEEVEREVPAPPRTVFYST